MKALAVSLVLAALAAPDPADRALKETGVPPTLRRRIDAALGAGMRCLARRQKTDGSWRIHRHRASHVTAGLTALVGLALLHGGVPASDTRIARARAFLRTWLEQGMPFRGERARDRNVYNLALSLAFLLESGLSPGHPLPRRLTRELARGGGRMGLWGYVPSATRMENLSTSLYAVLGLRAAWRRGIPVERRCLERLMRGLRVTCRDGSWGYSPAGLWKPWTPLYEAPYFSGAASGLAAYVMAGEILGLWSSPDEAREDRLVAASIDWLGRHFTPDRGPELAAMDEPLFRNPQYNLYAAERAGCLLALRTFGEVDWYLRGARFLVSSQGPDGAWSEEPELRKRFPAYWDSTVTTAFGVLFLARGTVPVSTPPHGADTPRGFDDLELARGPTLGEKDFADLAAAALDTFERLPEAERESRQESFALLGPRVIGPLVDALASGRAYRRRTAIEILEALVGDDLDFRPDAARADRRPALEMWEHWRRVVAPRLVLRERRLVLDVAPDGE